MEEKHQFEKEGRSGADRVTALGKCSTARRRLRKASNEQTLETVVVTAEKVSENLQRVPLSVTAISSDKLEMRGLTDLSDLAKAVPSLEVGSNGSFTVRGIGTLSFWPGIETSVATASTALPSATAPAGGGSAFNDIAQVEVLSGPQGLLFGKNASAGLLNITTKKPELGKTTFWPAPKAIIATPQGATYGGIFKATLNLPVSDVRHFASTPPIIMRIASLGSSEQFSRPTTRFTITRTISRRSTSFSATDDLTVYVIGTYGENHGYPISATFRSVGTVSDATKQQPSVNTGPLALDGVTAGPHNFLLGSDGGTWGNTSSYGLQAEVDYNLPGGWQIVNLAAYEGQTSVSNLDVDYTSLDAANINLSHTNFSQVSENSA